MTQAIRNNSNCSSFIHCIIPIPWFVISFFLLVIVIWYRVSRLEIVFYLHNQFSWPQFPYFYTFLTPEQQRAGNMVHWNLFLEVEQWFFLAKLLERVTSFQVTGTILLLLCVIIPQTLDINPGEYVSRKMRLLTQRGDRAKSREHPAKR
mgnify:CR=1 FL=1